MNTLARASAVAALAAALFAAGCRPEPAATASDAPALHRVRSVSQYGVTWTFDREAQVGRFVTGDFYVVGPVTVTDISPRPRFGRDIPDDHLSEQEKSRIKPEDRLRNGSMLNPPTTTAVAYDSRIRGHDARLAARLPVAMVPGDALVSSISLDKVQQNQVLPNPTRSTETSPMRTYAVLTCLAEAVPPDAFRPGYCDTNASTKIHLARDIRWGLLPQLRPADGMPDPAVVARMVQRPWIDHVYAWHSRELHASENMPGYGREIGRAVSLAALMLCSDLPRKQKEPLALGLIQIGIDNWSVATRSVRGEAGGWPAAGGFGNGRKLPIVMAALLLGDDQMSRIRALAAEASFGEDEHVEFGPSWTGAAVRFTGQYPLVGHRQIDRGPYEHLPPDQWPGNNKTMSEGYRRCCTSICWVGQALAVRILDARKLWDHDAFFAYVDRWMHEDDTAAVAEIQRVYPAFGAGIRQGRTQFDPWIDAMWATYRPTLADDPMTTWK
jgi:hypothetical protein